MKTKATIVAAALILLTSLLYFFGPNKGFTEPQQEFYDLTCMEMRMHPDAAVVAIIEVDDDKEDRLMVLPSLNDQARALIAEGKANNMAEGREKVLDPYFKEWLLYIFKNDDVVSVFIRCLEE